MHTNNDRLMIEALQRLKDAQQRQDEMGNFTFFQLRDMNYDPQENNELWKTALNLMHAALEDWQVNAGASVLSKTLKHALQAMADANEFQQKNMIYMRLSDMEVIWRSAEMLRDLGLAMAEKQETEQA